MNTTNKQAWVSGREAGAVAGNSLVMEALEPRLAPAGIVTLTTAGGVLTITGDTLNNGISITDVPASGTWSIADPTASGTTFALNGAAAVANLSIPAQNAIKATMGDGNDRVDVLPSAAPTGMILTGALNLNGGKGNDTFNLGNNGTYSLQVQGATVLDGGDNDDFMQAVVSVVFASTVDIKLGAGTDTCLLSNLGSGEHTFLKGVKVDVGTGSNTVTFASGRLDVLGGSLTVAGAGETGQNQTINLNPDFGTIQGSATVGILAGNATVKVGTLATDQFRFNGNLTINGSAGTDSLIFTGLTDVAGNLTVDFKDGTNSVTTATNSILHAGAFTIKGGKHMDTITLGSNATLDVANGLTMNLGIDANAFNMGTGSFATGSFTYAGGAGADTLTLGGQAFIIRGNANLNLGAGSNSVTVDTTAVGTIGGNLVLTGGAASDSLTIDGEFSVFGQTTIDFKEGQNQTVVATTGEAEFNAFTLKGGKDSDVFVLSGDINARGAFNINWGEGSDTLQGAASGELRASSFAFTCGATGVTTFIFDGLFQIAGAAVLNFGGGNNNAFVGATAFNVGSLSITSLAGADNVSISSPDVNVHGSTSINLGNGNNVVNASGTDADFNGNLVYTGGTNNDIVQFDNPTLRINGAVTFKGAAGGNQLLVNSTNATLGSVNFTGTTGLDYLILGKQDGTSNRINVLGGVTTNLGAGSNQTDITDTTVQGPVLLNSTASGSLAETDFFRVNGAAFNGPVTINMGSGVSTIFYDDTTTRGAFLLNSGAGNDNLNLDTSGGSATLSFWFDKVTVNSGAGNDSIKLGNAGNAGNVFQRAVIIDGGADTDTFIESNNTFNGGSPVVTNVP